MSRLCVESVKNNDSEKAINVIKWKVAEERGASGCQSEPNVQAH